MFKTEDFFNNTTLDINKVIEHISRQPQDMKEVMEFVIHKVEHFKEFEDKKEFEKRMYDHKIQELYAEYMKD
ncbi:MAG: hypothetical protein IIT65_00375 [Lachnospiraceae bacterium]|jgi:hypothetical protein|nr:hypothetical protein [Lachnospiraceae bacterium]